MTGNRYSFNKCLLSMYPIPDPTLHIWQSEVWKTRSRACAHGGCKEGKKPIKWLNTWLIFSFMRGARFRTNDSQLRSKPKELQRGRARSLKTLRKLGLNPFQESCPWLSATGGKKFSYRYRAGAQGGRCIHVGTHTHTHTQSFIHSSSLKAT